MPGKAPWPYALEVSGGEEMTMDLVQELRRTDTWRTPFSQGISVEVTQDAKLSVLHMMCKWQVGLGIQGLALLQDCQDDSHNIRQSGFHRISWSWQWYNGTSGRSLQDGETACTPAQANTQSPSGQDDWAACLPWRVRVYPYLTLGSSQRAPISHILPVHMAEGSRRKGQKS